MNRKQSKASLVLAAMVGAAALLVSPTEGSADTAAPPPAPVVDAAKGVDSTPGADKPAVGHVAAPATQQQAVVLARVGDQKITAEQFMNYMSRDTRLVLKSTTDQGRAEILREIILDRLIEEGLRREGWLPKDRAPTTQDYMQAYQQLASRYYPKANEVPPEEDLHKYYQQHPEFFGIPAMVRVSQIQFRVPAGADEKTRAAAKAKAEETRKRIEAGESFAVLAGALTENPQAKVAEGDLGFLQIDKDPWLQKAVADLRVGQISGVLESPAGYEILLLQDRKEAMLAPYANVRDNVIGRLRQEAHAKAREQYAWKLAKQVGVVVEKPELKGAIPETLP